MTVILYHTQPAIARLNSCRKIDKSCKQLDEQLLLCYTAHMVSVRELPFWIFYNPDKIGTDIYIDEFGFGVCTPGYSFGETRKNYLLQFVCDGIAHVTVAGEPFSVHKGEAFLLPPNIEHVYVSDREQPTVRAWISWSGEHSQYLAEQLYTFRCPYHIRVNDLPTVLDCFANLKQARDRCAASVSRKYAYFYNILSHCMRTETPLSQSQLPEHLLIDDITRYLDQCLADTPTIHELSRLFNYDASTIYRKFKKYTGLSPKEYMVHQRIACAKGLLRTSDLTIDEIAGRCGYLDRNTLNKLFVRHVGMSLAKYAAMFRSKKTETIPPPR